MTETEVLEMLEKCQATINSLTMAALTELKSFNNPAVLIKEIVAAVAILLG